MITKKCRVMMVTHTSIGEERRFTRWYDSPDEAATAGNAMKDRAMLSGAFCPVLLTEYQVDNKTPWQLRLFGF